MIRLGMIVTLCAACVATPGAAHWQYTRWGMSASQAIAASKGQLRHADPATDMSMPFGIKGAVGNFSSAGRPMRASLWFKDDQLDRVELSSDSEDACFALSHDLIGIYGQPMEHSSSVLTSSTWNDKVKANKIQFIGWGDQGCQIIYSPIANATATGL